MAAVTRTSPAATKVAKKKAAKVAKKTVATTVKKPAKKAAGKRAPKSTVAARRGNDPSAAGAGMTPGREQMIRERAYLRAEKRGFVGGDPVQDWLEAEAEVDRLLSGK
jgi:hypothetical protein